MDLLNEGAQEYYEPGSWAGALCLQRVCSNSSQDASTSGSESYQRTELKKEDHSLNNTPLTKVPKVTSRKRNGFKSLKPSDATTRPGKFPCKFCDAVFEHSQKLGGHTSRSHPGKSTEYLIKKETRERRTPFRLAHEAALS